MILFFKIHINCYASEKQTNGTLVLNVENVIRSDCVRKEVWRKDSEESRFATVKCNQITISRPSIAYIFILFCVVSVVVVVFVVVVVRTLLQPSARRHAVRLTTFCIGLHQCRTRDVHAMRIQFLAFQARDCEKS